MDDDKKLARYEEALKAIISLAEEDPKAYLYDPVFHAAVQISRRALGFWP